jgi:hypothetical protein
MNEMTEGLLRIALSATVPLWIEKLRARPWSYVEMRARECAQVVAEKGDVLQYRSKKAGESANAFNHLAEGLACCAFAIGGVRFLGDHYIAFHPDLERRPRRLDNALSGALGAVEQRVQRKPRPMP